MCTFLYTVVVFLSHISYNVYFPLHGSRISESHQLQCVLYFVLLVVFPDCREMSYVLLTLNCKYWLR